MAFCTKCGKQLADGEVCSCQTQQQTNTASTGAKKSTVISDVVDLFKGFKTPADAIGKFVDNAKVLSAIVLLAVCALVNAITNILYIVGANLEVSKHASSLSSTILGSTYSYAYSYVDSVADTVAMVLKCVLGFFLGLATPFATAAITALLFVVIIKAFDKTSTVTFQKGMIVACLSLVASVPCELVGSIVALIPFSFFNTVGGWFTSFGSAAGVVFVLIGLRKLVKDDNQLPAVYAIAAVASAIVLSILRLPVGI